MFVVPCFIWYPVFERAAGGLFASIVELTFGKAGGLSSVRFHHRDVCGEGGLQFPVRFHCWVMCRLPYSIWHFTEMVCLLSVDFSFFSFFLEFTGWVRFASLLPHGGTVRGISAVFFRGCSMFLLYFWVVVFVLFCGVVPIQLLVVVVVSCSVYSTLCQSGGVVLRGGRIRDQCMSTTLRVLSVQ